MKLRVLVLLSVLTVAGFAMATESADELTGKQIANMGVEISIEGVSFIEDGELYVTYENIVYAIHIGPEEYSEKIGFSEDGGLYLYVTGFVYEDNISAEYITVSGQKYNFRDSFGNSMWRSSLI